MKKGSALGEQKNMMDSNKHWQEDLAADPPGARCHEGAELGAALGDLLPTRRDHRCAAHRHRRAAEPAAQAVVSWYDNKTDLSGRRNNYLYMSVSHKPPFCGVGKAVSS